MVECAKVTQEFYGGLCMERDMRCEVVVKPNGSSHMMHLQTHVAVLNIDKLRSVASCDTVTPRARDLAKRKLEILERDNFECVMCKETSCLTIDHIRPLALDLGIENLDKYVRAKINQLFRSTANGYPLDNCQTVCVWCHGMKDGWLKDRVGEGQ